MNSSINVALHIILLLNMNRESVFYNQLLDMILSILLLVVAAWAQSNVLPIRTGTFILI